MRDTTQRCYNFNAGPAAMPLSVLDTLQRDLVDYAGRGVSVLEMSHRSADFIEIAEKAEADLRALLGIGEDYAVLFMQGGASTQFALTQKNLDIHGCVAFANTGYWSRKAMDVARLNSEVHEVTCLAGDVPVRVAPTSQWQDIAQASYLHITDNETIDGVQLHELPDTHLPIVADLSSSILSKPIDINRYGLVYAGAQKNIGPAGITLVIIRHDLLKRSVQQKTLAPVFNYAAVHAAKSMLNTPPTFAWYAAGLVFQWLLDEGGLATVEARNQQQAQRVYKAIDDSDVFVNHVDPQNRSLMNVPFQTINAEQQRLFLQGAAERGLVGLKGHKSIGGLRASLYNAVTDEAVDALLEYMHQFNQRPRS